MKIIQPSNFKSSFVPKCADIDDNFNSEPSNGKYAKRYLPLTACEHLITVI